MLDDNDVDSGCREKRLQASQVGLETTPRAKSGRQLPEHDDGNEDGGGRPPVGRCREITYAALRCRRPAGPQVSIDPGSRVRIGRVRIAGIDAGL